MADKEFQKTMLEATFAFARLALTNAILLNGAAATALLAFLGTAVVPNRPPLIAAIFWFGFGTMAGGASSLLAYFGQRQNWEWSKVEDTPAATLPKSVGHGRAAHVLIWLAIIAGAAAYILFFVGAVLAACGLR